MTAHPPIDQPKRRPLWIGVIVLVIVVAAGIALYTSQANVGPFVGKRAPAFTVVDLDGNAVSLSDLRGKPIFVNFWATWCTPCRYEMPAIQQLYEARGDEFAVVAVSDEAAGTVRRYVEAAGYTFPVYIDQGRRMNKTYLIRGLPTSVFIDASGVIQAIHVGQLSLSQMERYLDLAMP